MTEDPNQFSRDAWDANAEVWDSRMGDEGNDFFRILQWPVIASFLEPHAASTSESNTSTGISKSNLSFFILVSFGLISFNWRVFGPAPGDRWCGLTTCACWMGKLPET